MKFNLNQDPFNQNASFNPFIPFGIFAAIIIALFTGIVIYNNFGDCYDYPAKAGLACYSGRTLTVEGIVAICRCKK